MGITEAIAVGSVQLFKLRLLGRMQTLAREARDPGEGGFLLPVAILLLADQAHGGELDSAALGRYFGLADFEAANLLDFYFPGWSATAGKGAAKELHFDHRGCDGFRRALRAAGVKSLGGRSELVLVNASHVRGTVWLGFSTAIRCDLAAMAAQLGTTAEFPVAAVVQTLAAAAAAAKGRGRDALGPPGFQLDARTGLATAPASLLAGFLDRWLAALRAVAEPAARVASTLAALPVRNLGPDIPLVDL